MHLCSVWEGGALVVVDQQRGDPIQQRSGTAALHARTTFAYRNLHVL